MSNSKWVLRRVDRGPEGIEYEIHDESNKTLVCSRITNRREADVIRMAPRMLVALKAVKPILEVSQDPKVKSFMRELEDIILKAGVIFITTQV